MTVLKTKLLFLFLIIPFLFWGQIPKDTLYIGYSRDFKKNLFFEIEYQPNEYYKEFYMNFLNTLQELNYPADSIKYYEYLTEDSTRANHMFMGYRINVKLKTTIQSISYMFNMGLKHNSIFKIYNFYIAEKDKKVFQDSYSLPWVLYNTPQYKAFEDEFEKPFFPIPKTDYKKITIPKTDLEKLNYVQLDDYITTFNYKGRDYYYLKEKELEELFNNKPVLFFKLRDLGKDAYFEEMSYFIYDYNGLPAR